MKRLLIAVTLAGLLGGTFTAPADASHRRRKDVRYDTELSIHYGVNRLQGAIGSKRQECIEGIKVDVFRDGNFIGRPTTDEVGYYELPSEQGSRFTAQIHEFVFKITKKRRYICKADVITIP